jgi:hypothetical protein
MNCVEKLGKAKQGSSETLIEYVKIGGRGNFFALNVNLHKRLTLIVV